MMRNVKPVSNRPPDFEGFWSKTRQALSDVDQTIKRIERPESYEHNIRLEHISFRSLGEVWVSSYGLFWNDQRLRPLVVHSHGYGSSCRIRRDWAEAGMHVVGVDIRGFGRSFESCPRQSPWGYILTGIDAPETSILRGGVCDYMRVIEVAQQILQGRVSRTVLHGVSFAGGLALMAEAVSPCADFLVVGVPTLGWTEGRHFFVRSGSGAEISRFLEERPESAEDVMLVLRYFDVMSFAGMVRCPTLVGVGLEDDVVPAHTVYAVANHLEVPFEIMEFPISHSSHPDEELWKHFERRWIDITLNGVPNTFGSRIHPG